VLCWCLLCIWFNICISVYCFYFFIISFGLATRVDWIGHMNMFSDMSYLVQLFLSFFIICYLSLWLLLHAFIVNCLIMSFGLICFLFLINVLMLPFSFVHYVTTLKLCGLFIATLLAMTAFSFLLLCFDSLIQCYCCTSKEKYFVFSAQRYMLKLKLKWFILHIFKLFRPSLKNPWNGQKFQSIDKILRSSVATLLLRKSTRFYQW